MVTPSDLAVSGNRLIRALPADESNRLLAKLDPVDLPLRKVLHEPGQPITHVYFVETGVVSLVTLLEGGQEVEVGLIGNEGMVGVAAALGAERVGTEAVVQVRGRALRLSVEALRAELARGGALPGLLHRSMLALHAQVTQTVACNTRHTLEERLARWLLMVHDRVDSDDLPMTHELIAKMLSVRRAGVTVALGLLERTASIRTGRGSVCVLDRHRLEEVACECYPTVRRETSALLPD